MSEYITYVLVAGAAFLLAGPQIVDFLKMLVPPLLFRKPELTKSGITFKHSISSLAEVRQRLVDTGGVSETADSAIEVLTHELLAGSDKP